MVALVDGHRLVVFLDFDGTLAPIVDEPAAAALPASTVPILGRLAATVPVAIVSGRGADDVTARVGLDDVHVAGSHGFEIVRPGGDRHEHPGAAAAQPALDAAADDLDREIGAVPGVIIEPKRFGLTVHDRMVAEPDLARVRSAAATVGAQHGLWVTSGKRVTELRPPVAWDKGQAVLWLLDDLRIAGAVPVYIGDDRTDEDAFVALGSDALTVVIGGDDADAARTSAAGFRLTDTGQVADLLERLIDLGARRPSPPPG